MVRVEPGYQLNQYVFVQFLGEGGMAEVWRGRHAHLDYEVAIKFLKPQFAHDRDLQERFLNEGKRQANLDHPHIVRAIDFISDAGSNYLVMKYVEGGGLDRRIEDAHGPLAMEDTLAISYQVLSAIDYAHRQGVIHRDVKPSNILLDRDGNCYLTDFGIALAAGEHRFTRTGTVIGTDYYLSPEQIRTPKDVDHRTDVYAFGVVLFEMLTGTLPFAYDNEFLLKKAHIEEEPPKPSKRNPAVSKAMESVVLRALAKDADARWAGCGEMADALEMAAPGTRPQTRGTRPATVPPTAPGPVAPEPPPKRNRSLALGAGICVAVVAIASGIWATLGSGGKVTPPAPRASAPVETLARPVEPIPEPVKSVPVETRPVAKAIRPVVKDVPKKPQPDVPPPPPPAPVAEDPAVLFARGRSQFASDPAAARESFRKASQGGNVQAMVSLGAMYSQGLGGDKNYVEALRLFRQAADKGFVRGMYNVGLLYEGDKGVPRSPANQAEAAGWYAKALKAGHDSEAAFRLAIMYEEGRGVPKDLSQAAQLYKVSGTPEAKARLARIVPQ